MSNDPLRTIYKEIIQPLIGDFFEVDAALPVADFAAVRDSSDDEEDKACHCCVPRDYQTTSVTDRDGSVRSDGKYFIYWKINIYRRKSSEISIA